MSFSLIVKTDNSIAQQFFALQHTLQFPAKANSSGKDSVSTIRYTNRDTAAIQVLFLSTFVYKQWRFKTELCLDMCDQLS